jgi:hypothetical protein
MRPFTPADMTAAIVLRAARTGAPLSIPGALDVRVGHAPSRTSSATEGAPPVAKDAGGSSDPERREYELAGGGAPSERGIIRRANVLERLCSLLR